MIVSDSGDVDFGERLAAMESVFGKSDDIVLHAPIPFEFGHEAGGLADIVKFSNHITGVVYATCDLMGRADQIPNRLGAYELAVCHRSDEDWGARYISKLAYYTLMARVEPGQTMDLGTWMPTGSSITAIMFEELASFEIRGQPAGVLVCIGITADELSACRRGQHDRVIKALKSKGVYPFTDFKRRSTLKWF